MTINPKFQEGISPPTEVELENVFVKHYAPNHMLAPKDNRGIIKILQNLAKC